MERICSHCHALLAAQTEADWCPACDGAIVERTALHQDWSESLPPAVALHPKSVVDHRGIVLPHRHAVGGIITPQ